MIEIVVLSNKFKILPLGSPLDGVVHLFNLRQAMAVNALKQLLTKAPAGCIIKRIIFYVNFERQ